MALPTARRYVLCLAEKVNRTTDRRKAGSKHHLLVEAQGVTVNVIPIKANRHDMTKLLPLDDGVPSIRGKCGPFKPLRKVRANRV